MKVAIIGAGVAGLACAHELEKYGVQPIIFEKNSFIGEAYPHVTGILNITNRPIKDAIQYFKNEFDIEINPLNTINSITHISPNTTTVIKGNLGYTIKYTKDRNAIKGQMYSNLKNTTVYLNEFADYKALSKKYEYVVIATGNNAFAEELGCWQLWLKAYVRGAVVLGDFDVHNLTAWVNKDYCKNGYAYMTSFDNKKAVIVLIVTDVNDKEIDHYWELFLDAENIRYKTIEEFKLQHSAGFVYPYRFENIFFAGNSAGGVDPFLGFGILNAVTMGVSAARTIVNGTNYEKQIRSMMKRNLQMRQFRKVMETMTNKDFDNLVSIIGMSGIKQVLYNSPINVAKYGALASKLILKGSKSK